jgi:hypothetical protein
VSVLVPTSPLIVSADTVKSGYAVRSKTWRRLGELMNYMLSRGGALIPAYNPGSTVSGEGSVEYYYRAKPMACAVTRLWLVRVRVDASDSVQTVTINPNSTGDQVFSVSTSARDGAALYVLEPVASPGSSEQELMLEIANSAGDDIEVMSVCCVDVPRVYLDTNTTEYGVEVGTCDPRNPMFDGSGESIVGVADSIGNGWGLTRRPGLLMWAVDALGSGEYFSTDATTATDIFQLDPVILGRRYLSSTAFCYPYVYAQTTHVDTTAEVTISTTSGGSCTIEIPTGSDSAFDWYGGSADQFYCDSELLSSSDGRRSSRWDEMTIQAEVTGGPSHPTPNESIRIASLCVIEAF